MRALVAFRWLVTAWEMVRASLRAAVGGREVPFLAATIFTILGWLIAGYAERVADSPTIAFRRESFEASPNQWVHAVTLKNLSLEHNHPLLEFGFQSLTRCLSVDPLDPPIPVAPAWPGRESGQQKPGLITHKIVGFQPNEEYVLTVRCGDRNEVSFVLYDSGETAVRLIPWSSLEARLLRFEKGIIAFFVLLFLLVLAANAWFNYRAVERPTYSE